MINHILYHNGISYTFLTMTIIIGYHNIYFKYDNIKHGKFNDSTNIAYSFTRRVYHAKNAINILSYFAISCVYHKDIMQS